jgi:hypothetical protein
MNVHAIGVHIQDYERYFREIGIVWSKIPRCRALNDRELRQAPREFTTNAVAREMLLVQVEDTSTALF